jgi:predicted dehydrogenase
MSGGATREVRWGLVGTGDIVAKRVAAALREAPRSRLLALSRRRHDLVLESARRFGAVRGHAEWKDLVRDPEVDAVYVATPVHLHAEMAVAAADAGKHVLCEKPMALDVRECDRMIRAAGRNGVKLGVAYYRRFYPTLRRTRELLLSGALGDVVLAHAEAFEPFDLPPDHPRHWFLERDKAGGGPMFDFGCHRVEVLLSLLGPLADVTGALARSAFEREVEDTAVAVLRFASGAVATIAVTHAAAERRDALEIVGRRGSLRIPDLNGPELRLLSEGREAAEQHSPPDNRHLPLVEQFVEAVLQGEAPGVDGGMGREVNRVLAEIYRGGVLPS